MAGVISVYQVEAWFNRHCSLADDWGTWCNAWNTVGLNDTDPPDPPEQPISPTQKKMAFCDAIAYDYTGEPPPFGWPNN